MPFEKELFVATQALKKASLLTKRIQSQVIANKDSTITKEDTSPVTVGDYSAQAIVINAIKANFPQDKIVGEEESTGLSDSFVSRILSEIQENDKHYAKTFGVADSRASGMQFTNAEYPLSSLDDVRKVIDMGDFDGGAKSRFWCLDPIDGTKGFLRGEQFAVCLALIVDGVVELGCIGCPNLQLADYGGQDTNIEKSQELGYLFRAVRGQGAFFAPTISDFEWLPVHCRTLNSTEPMVSLEGVEKGHSAHSEQSQVKEKLDISRSLHLDSQVKYCLLVLGLGDVYLRLPIKLSYEEKIWDHAAGNVLVTEAGGIHTDSFNNVPLDFSRGRTLQSKGVIASSGPEELHARIVAASSEVMNKASK
ncbi:LANO_0A04500g1_1 [Lachancea nothofagi CBS 11611]|uniref:3'(2'),5'-bisphosphate nucleotidase n=1 Tax=Lachancea nothofagi CBS 11611 TaxID=1266666 RepID=A0A1G4IQ86_9SACH|nr:LANO_0A04500g1_1 [Lachancea nothofagi CBS 11611]